MRSRVLVVVEKYKVQVRPWRTVQAKAKLICVCGRPVRVVTVEAEVTTRHRIGTPWGEKVIGKLRKRALKGQGYRGHAAIGAIREVEIVT